MAIASRSKKRRASVKLQSDVFTDFPVVVLYKTATLACESNRAWLAKDRTELVSAINAIYQLSNVPAYDPLTPFSVDNKIYLYCNEFAEESFNGAIIIKKLAYNTIATSEMTWDI